MDYGGRRPHTKREDIHLVVRRPAHTYATRDSAHDCITPFTSSSRFYSENVNGPHGAL